MSRDSRMIHPRGRLLVAVIVAGGLTLAVIATLYRAAIKSALAPEPATTLPVTQPSRR